MQSNEHRLRPPRPWQRLCDPHRVGLSPYVAERVPYAFLFNI